MTPFPQPQPPESAIIIIIILGYTTHASQEPRTLEWCLIPGMRLCDREQEKV